MNCTVLPLHLKLKREFIVAGGRESLKRNYLVVLDDVGLGEASGSVHYGVTPEEIENDLSRISQSIRGQTDEAIYDILLNLEGEFCAPALCAFSSAWHDLMCKRAERPLYDRLGVPAPAVTSTSVTVSIGDMEAWDEYLRAGFDRLKIKMSDDDAWNRAAMNKIGGDDRCKYRIDANAGWTIETALRFIDELPEEKIQLIEQPFAADDIENWNRLRSQTSIPLVMDESIGTVADVKRVAEYVDGVNIKIQKSGLLETAVAAMRAAKAAKLLIMVGCMIESSVGIAIGYHLSGFADFLDLDGRLLIESDPFSGLRYEKNKLILTGEYGHGVSLA